MNDSEILQKISEDIANIHINNERIKSDVSSLTDRIKNIESKDIENGFYGRNFASLEAAGRRSETENFTSAHLNSTAAASGLQAVKTDFQSEFVAIKDSVSKVKLPAEYKLNDNRFAVDKKDNIAYNILSKCARYSETTIKLLQEFPDVEEGSDTERSLEKLLTVEIAQQRYLQEQYASLVVQKDFGQHTAKVFRSLQSNSSAFPQASIETLKSAVQLTSSSGNNGHNNNSYNSNRGYSSYNHRSRGSWRSRGRGRGDVFHQMTRDVPSARPDADLQ